MSSSSLYLEWKNLNLQVQRSHFDFSKCKTRVEEKKILSNVNGHIESGQLVAILGSSGAGKTSLLAAISKRYRGPIDGRILLNGEPINRKTMTKLSCFVPQFDITMASLTPNEHLYFMGELKLDRRWTRVQKYQRIQMLLRQLGLQRMANTRISSLSGGERKRLNMATDLLTNPPILFCDEPTTGLDSYNALSVVKCLQQLTQINANEMMNSGGNQSATCSDEMELMEARRENSRPKAILCSIHQPTSEIFQCFSHIILMYAGHAVFQGTRDDAITYFSRLGFKCPITYNPADYYLNVLSDNVLSEFESSAEKPFFDRPIELLRKSFDYRPLDQNLMEPLAIEDHQEHNNTLWVYQVFVLIRRSYLNSKRNVLAYLINLALFLIPYFVMAAIYYKTTGHTQESIQDVRGALFTIIAEVVFTTSYSVIHFYPSQMPILRRETNEHIYKFSAYYVAETLCTFPSGIIRSFVSMTVTYLFVGFYKGLKSYFQFVLTLTVTSFTSHAYGLMLSGLFSSDALTAEIAPPFDLLFLLMAGLYINLKQYPYVRYVSVFFYSNEALATLYWYDITRIDCPSILNNKCFHNGTEVLDAFSYSTSISGVYFDYLGLLCLGLIMHIIAFFGIRRFIRSTGYY